MRRRVEIGGVMEGCWDFESASRSEIEFALLCLIASAFFSFAASCALLSDEIASASDSFGVELDNAERPPRNVLLSTIPATAMSASALNSTGGLSLERRNTTVGVPPAGGIWAGYVLRGVVDTHDTAYLNIYHEDPRIRLQGYAYMQQVGREATIIYKGSSPPRAPSIIIMQQAVSYMPLPLSTVAKAAK